VIRSRHEQTWAAAKVFLVTHEVPTLILLLAIDKIAPKSEALVCFLIRES
jgi:hypothetical protein